MLSSLAVARTERPRVVRSTAVCAGLLIASFLTAPAGAAAQDGKAATTPGIFEIERPHSFLEAAATSDNEGPIPRDWYTYFARYRLVDRTLAGSLAGAIGGMGSVVIVCLLAENSDDGTSELLAPFDRCLNRDRWFGFVVGGSLVGTVIGGARGASLPPGRFGALSPLRTSECSFRQGLRRALAGAVIGSVPSAVHYATGGDALSASLIAPVLQGTGAIIAIWGCIGEPRLGPSGVPPLP